MSANQEIEGFIGRSFGGYRVTRFIGSGRTGAVFAGVQEASPENAVAIKLLDPSLTDQTFIERFEENAFGVTGLKHPNIVAVHDFGSDGSLHFIVTDLIEGESLRDRLVAAHSMGVYLSAETITSVAQQVGGALFFAQRSGYIHGGIKPENILMTNDGWVHVSDFGLIQAVGEQRPARSGIPAGAPEYLAPEQAQGVIPISPLVDLYSLAIVIYEMTVGRVPFQARSAATVIQMQEHATPPLPSSLLPGFPPKLESVLMRALEKDPSNRFQSVDAFLGSLLAAMGPTKRGAAGATGTAAIAPKKPAVAAEPGPPPTEMWEPDRPISVPGESGRPASARGSAATSRFAATRSRRGVLAEGAFVIVIAVLLIFSPSVFPSVETSKQPETTTTTTTTTADDTSSSGPSTAPVTSPPPAPSPTEPPAPAATNPPTEPPPASSIAPVTAPPPPPAFTESAERIAVPMSVEVELPAAPPRPTPSPPPPSSAVPVSPEPSPPTPAATVSPEPPPPSPRELGSRFPNDFFASQTPADPPRVGPNESSPDDGPADSEHDGPPPREQFERDFVRDFFNEP